MAELGQTTDPRELVPGSPESVKSDAQTLARHSAKLDSTGEALKRVDIDDWVGEGSQAFWECFLPQPPKWLKVSDANEQASQRLIDYADVLYWAQQQAGEAIELWERGEAATRQAIAEYRAAAAHASAAELPPFTDPGDELRQRAQTLLANAREAVEEAGDTVASALSSALDTVVSAVTEGWESTGKASFSGPSAGASASGPDGNSLGKLKAYAYVFKTSAEGKVTRGDLTLSGKAGSTFGTAATAAASLENGLNASAKAWAGIKGSAGGTISYGPASLNANVQGVAGAEAHAGVGVSTQGIHAGAGALAGAKATVNAGAEIGGIGVGFTAEAWAGAGAEAGFNAGMGPKGNFHLGFHMGAAVGIGGGFGFQITVDPQEVVETVSDAAEAVGDALETVGDALASAAEYVTPW